MKLLVCGGRDYTDMNELDRYLTVLHMRRGIDIIIHGDCKGADTLAKMWAKAHGIHHAAVEALWDFYDRGAGPKRNATMLLLAPDLVVAFPGGAGTEGMIKLATRANIPVSRVGLAQEVQR